MYPQNKEMYPQFAGDDKDKCIHKIKKCGYKNNKMQRRRDKLLSYNTKKEEEKSCIRRFVDTTQPHHKIDGGGFCA